MGWCWPVAEDNKHSRVGEYTGVVLPTPGYSRCPSPAVKCEFLPWRGSIRMITDIQFWTVKSAAPIFDA